MRDSARLAYDELSRYFGLRSSDSYLNKATGQGPANGAGKQSPLGKAYHALFGDESKNYTIEEICASISEMDEAEQKKTFCVTPYSQTAKNSLVNRKTINDPAATGLNDQGIGGPGRAGVRDCYTVQGMAGQDKFPDNANRIDVVQVFPVKCVPEVADTDVITLYLSTINSVNMSLAVPYVDVIVSTEGEGALSQEPFSFGKFLGATDTDAAAKAAFVDRSAGASSTARTVTSMEIFTSPQTLVNATPENVRFDENSDARRPRDIFRPFLSIENMSISVVPSGAGLIAFKTAQMKLRLFDRGRLADIVPIVAPSRFGLVKFDISYGWFHPAGGLTKGRQSDANDDRIGELIDSMYVTESFQVVNSNFSFEQDGSVSIDLKLSMLGRTAFANESVKFRADDANLKNIQVLLNNLQQMLRGSKSKALNEITFLTGNVNTFLQMKTEDVAKLRGFLRKGSDASPEIKDVIKKLFGADNRKGGLREALTKDRTESINDFIQNVQKKDDPFIRLKGLAGGAKGLGVTEKELKGGDYASFGRIVVDLLGDVFQEHGDVIFVFGCFNKNAGAMYDHNISQFPIKLKSSKKAAVTLQRMLLKTYTENGDVTPEQLISQLNKFFLSREDTEAYGLSQIYKNDPVINKEGEIVEQLKEKVNEELPASKLAAENKRIANLKLIYGEGRESPDFTVPRINMRIDSKPDKNGKIVTRVIFTDQAASNVGDIAEIFDDVTRSGSFTKQNIPSTADGSIRGAQHNELANEVFQKMRESKLFDVSGDEKILKLKDFGSVEGQLRKIFYEHFPTLIYGSMGSGIISAQLSSNQNDALTTIALQKEPDSSPIPPGLPVMIHPTQLSMEVFGTPLFKYSQKFFIDFGTGTSADNFYVVSGVDMNFGPGEFKTSLKMTQLDAFGRFMNTKKVVEQIVVAAEKKQKDKTSEKSKPQSKPQSVVELDPIVIKV